MLKTNKRIKSLLKIIGVLEKFYKIIFFIISFIIFCYSLMSNIELIEHIMFFIIGIILFFILIIINVYLRKLLKNEYIKENKDIEYLKYVPKEKIDIIEQYIILNKQKLEEELEFEKLKNNISNF